MVCVRYQSVDWHSQQSSSLGPAGHLIAPCYATIRWGLTTSGSLFIAGRPSDPAQIILLTLAINYVSEVSEYGERLKFRDCHCFCGATHGVTLRFYWDQDIQSFKKHFAGGRGLHGRPKGQARRADALQQAADRSAQRPHQVTKREQTGKNIEVPLAENQVLVSQSAG